MIYKPGDILEHRSGGIFGIYIGYKEGFYTIRWADDLNHYENIQEDLHDLHKNWKPI